MASKRRSGAPHAQHMPSHIYSMVGMGTRLLRPIWPPSRSPRSMPRRASLTARSPAFRTRTHFMQYAYLQLGQDAKAKAVIEENAAIQKVVGPQLVRMGQAAILLAICSSGRTGRGRRARSRSARRSAGSSHYYFARASGAARSSDVAAAQADVVKLIVSERARRGGRIRATGRGRLEPRSGR